MKVIQVKVKPNARASQFEQLADGTWLARIKAPSVDGKANEELVRLVARHFGLRKAQVTIRSGAWGRMKRVQLEA